MNLIKVEILRLQTQKQAAILFDVDPMSSKEDFQMSNRIIFISQDFFSLQISEYNYQFCQNNLVALLGYSKSSGLLSD